MLNDSRYICLYTLMDHVEQLSQPSTNSHQLAHTGRDRTGWDKGDILPEMPYICLYTLMDHVDQLSQPSTNSHQLAPTGGVTYGTGHGTRDMGQRGTSSPILKKKFGTTTKCSSLKGLRTMTARYKLSFPEITARKAQQKQFR